MSSAGVDDGGGRRVLLLRLRLLRLRLLLLLLFQRQPN